MYTGIRVLSPVLKATLGAPLTGQQSSPFPASTPPKQVPHPSAMTLLVPDGLMNTASYSAD